MLQLYYNVASPPSRAVLQMIRILGLEVEVKVLDQAKAEHLTPEFLKINPMHQVPALVDGDFVVTESRAILAYLVNAKKPGSSFYPSEPKVRALVDQRLYFEAINFFELAASIMRPLLLQPNSPVPADKIVKLKETLKHFENFLTTNLYFAGNQPTIVDISILSTYIVFKKIFTNYGELPKVDAWFLRCQSLPGFEENLAGGEAFDVIMKARGMSPISLA